VVLFNPDHPHVFSMADLNLHGLGKSRLRAAARPRDVARLGLGKDAALQRLQR
jgi:hypothetical protein